MSTVFERRIICSYSRQYAKSIRIQMVKKKFNFFKFFGIMTREKNGVKTQEPIH